MEREINKILKRIHSLKNNDKERCELYNALGSIYSDVGHNQEAIENHEKALEVARKLGDISCIAVTYRAIGEARAALAQFDDAIKCTKRYLELAQRIDDLVEIQRAWTTLGRVYLMQAQDLKETSSSSKEIVAAASEAEKRFVTALSLAESLRDEVDERELMQMKCGLYQNIGLVKELCGKHRDCIQRFQLAIDLCKKHRLKEDLYRCQIVLAGIFRQQSNIKAAVRASEEAINTAKSIGKKLYTCEAYIERGLVRMLQKDFKNAKRTFAQAYLEKSPNEDDHSKAIRFTKIAHLISDAYDKVKLDDTPIETKITLCDKLGDLFMTFEFYKFAVDFYKLAFSNAKMDSRPREELGRLLHSVAEAYAEDGQCEHAIICYEKSIQYMESSDEHECRSLIKIAYMHEQLEHPKEQVCNAYDKALQKAEKLKLMYRVLKYYIPYLKEHVPENWIKIKELETTLENLESQIADEEDLDDDESNIAIDIDDAVPDVDDVITDDEDNDEVMCVGRRRPAGSSKGRFKADELGNTPLHEACIRGDMKRAKALIEQGHDVNPQDNAGWIPLHECCNHGHYEIAEFLIEHGANVNHRGLKGVTPLHDAATNGHFEIMRLLISNGANVIALTDSGETVLGCLRDYKNRTYDTMTNRDSAEYKMMEADLMNAMDKCGFDLIETIKPRQDSKPKQDPKPKPEPKVNSKVSRTELILLSSDSDDAVSEYRNAMRVLKKRKTDTFYTTSTSDQRNWQNDKTWRDDDWDEDDALL